MTKAWDAHKGTIKDLYMKHTLAIVRQIMQEQYNFKASVRSYRQKLDEWGCTKYNKREKKKNNGSKDDSSSTDQPPQAQSRTSQGAQVSSGETSCHDISSSVASPITTTWPPEYDTSRNWTHAFAGGSDSQQTFLTSSSAGHSSHATGFWGQDGLWYTYPTGYTNPVSGWNDLDQSTATPQMNYTTAETSYIQDNNDYNDREDTEYSDDGTTEQQ